MAPPGIPSLLFRDNSGVLALLLFEQLARYSVKRMPLQGLVSFVLQHSVSIDLILRWFIGISSLVRVSCTCVLVLSPVMTPCVHVCLRFHSKHHDDRIWCSRVGGMCHLLAELRRFAVCAALTCCRFD